MKPVRSYQIAPIWLWLLATPVLLGTAPRKETPCPHQVKSFNADPASLEPLYQADASGAAFWEQMPGGLRRLLVQGLIEEREQLEKDVSAVDLPQAISGLRNEIRKLEAAHTNEIADIVRRMMDARYGQAAEDLDVRIATEVPKFFKSEGKTARLRKNEKVPQNWDQGLAFRTELRRCWQQGEGRMGMTEFAFYQAPQINAIVPGLAEKYQRLHRLFRLNQLSQWPAVESEQGLSKAVIEFELWDENDGTRAIVPNQVWGCAVGENGWWTAHQARKAACQMATPNEAALRWKLPLARRHELDVATTSAFAQHRQAIIGPLFSTLLRRRLNSVFAPGSTLKEDQYLHLIDGFFSLYPGAFVKTMELLFASNYDLDRTQQDEVKALLENNGVAMPAQVQRTAASKTVQSEVPASSLREGLKTLLAAKYPRRQFENMNDDQFVRSLAKAYRIENSDVVATLMELPYLSENAALTILKNLAKAYTGAAENVAAVIGAVPTQSRPMLMGHILSEIGRRSVTETALGMRLIAGLSSESSLVRAIFKTMVEQNLGRLVTSPMALAVENIARRMMGSIDYAAAEHQYLADTSVAAGQKSYLVRVRRRMSVPSSVLMESIPRSQRAQVRTSMFDATNYDVFEQLAKSQRGAMGLLRAATPESFEFERFHFPNLGTEHNGVTLTRQFEMQVTPVTQLQWQLVMGSVPQPFFRGNPNNPMENVTRAQAQEYVDRLTQLDPYFRYELPTEAEWEFARRAGGNTRFAHGNSRKLLVQYAWTDENSGGHTHPVALLKPNANGLYDMDGNVYEWTSGYFSIYPPSGHNPLGANEGTDAAIMGGSWKSVWSSVEASARISHRATESSTDMIGLRVLRRAK